MEQRFVSSILPVQLQGSPKEKKKSGAYFSTSNKSTHLRREEAIIPSFCTDQYDVSTFTWEALIRQTFHVPFLQFLGERCFSMQVCVSMRVQNVCGLSLCQCLLLQREGGRVWLQLETAICRDWLTDRWGKAAGRWNRSGCLMLRVTHWRKKKQVQLMAVGATCNHQKPELCAQAWVD